MKPGPLHNTSLAKSRRSSETLRPSAACWKASRHGSLTMRAARWGLVRLERSPSRVATWRRLLAKSRALPTARFQAGPRGGKNGLYLTGDLGRLLPDGCLVHVGRKDSQVKIRAQRIELAEIGGGAPPSGQYQRSGCCRPRGRNWRQTSGGLRGCRRDTIAEIHDLSEGLSKSLPDYMIPATFVALRPCR